jgi:hypothetical protein
MEREKGLLDGLARVVRVEQDAVCQTVESTPLRLVDLTEGSLVARRSTAKHRSLGLEVKRGFRRVARWLEDRRRLDHDRFSIPVEATLQPSRARRGTARAHKKCGPPAHPAAKRRSRGAACHVLCSVTRSLDDDAERLAPVVRSALDDGAEPELHRGADRQARDRRLGLQAGRGVDRRLAAVGGSGRASVSVRVEGRRRGVRRR